MSITEHGPGACLDVIAVAARVCKGGLSHHFRSREDLLLALIEELYERSQEQTPLDLASLRYPTSPEAISELEAFLLSLLHSGMPLEHNISLVGAFLGWSLPWLETVVVIPAGILTGLPPIPIIVVGAFGNLITVALAAFAGEEIKHRWSAWRVRRKSGPPSERNVKIGQRIQQLMDRGRHLKQFRRLFWINLVLAIPVIALSPMFASLLGYTVPAWAT